MDAIKAEQKEELEALKDSKADQLKELKKAQEQELKELKRSQQDQLTALKESQDAQLSYLKQSNSAKLKEIQAANAAQIEALENGGGNDSMAELAEAMGTDTAKAAEMANKAIVDMSDNANKMGKFHRKPIKKRLNCWKPLRVA